MCQTNLFPASKKKLKKVSKPYIVITLIFKNEKPKFIKQSDFENDKGRIKIGQ